MTQKQELPVPGALLVRKSNAIVRARWKPSSIWESRIVALVASKVQPDDDDFFTYKIPVAELTGVSDANLGGIQYQEIASSISRLGKAIIHIKGKKPRDFRQYNVFSMCGYENGCIIAEFHPDLKIHFLQLKSHFTEFRLLEYLSLPSTYSQKLFEILKSWQSTGEVTLCLRDLHEQLNAPDSIRKNFAQFRRWVLEKAHKDINEKTTLRFEWEPIKEGRAVTAIRVVFGRKKQIAIQKQKTADAITATSKQNNINMLAAVDCLKAKGGQCQTQDHKRKKVCEICHQYVQT
jgi:plasmid replication initiation protein